MAGLVGTGRLIPFFLHHIISFLLTVRASVRFLTPLPSLEYPLSYSAIQIHFEVSVLPRADSHTRVTCASHVIMGLEPLFTRSWPNILRFTFYSSAWHLN
jgi:hypothetical protein